MSRASQFRLQKFAESISRKSSDPDRHKCFVSYHAADEGEVTQFIQDFGVTFIPTVVGITDDDDFVDSDDTDYIMDRIREEYLSDSTVTIVMVGKCTWARRFVDWEIYATLRRYKGYPPSGLMAITLPSMANDDSRRLPPRLDDNVDDDKKYARWWKYPTAGQGLRNLINIAYESRSSKTSLIDNSRARKKYSSECP
jgi:hypothetical protein